jgi:uncharacterized membrane protein YjgN (DUF898 family)
MEQNLTPNTFTLQVDVGNIPYLQEAAKWAKFLAIIGFIFCTLMVIFAFFAGTFLSRYFNQLESSTTNVFAMSGGVITVIYILVALLYFIPSLYLFNFASKMQTALRNNDQVNLNSSFRNLKACFKFWGILLIIVLCIYAIAIIFAVVAGTTLGS